jgi:uncharacterized protein (TIGR00730 family)
MAGQPPHVAVFGSSEPAEGERLYEIARQLGAALARSGCVVVTGGYGGVMEAACRGAHEFHGRTIGVVCDVFAGRTPCAYLDERIATPNLHERTRELIERCHGFVVLEGKAGTLAELTFLWALERAGCLAGRPVVVLGEAWPDLLEALERGRWLDPHQLRTTMVAATPAEAAAAVLSGMVSERR